MPRKRKSNHDRKSSKAKMMARKRASKDQFQGGASAQSSRSLGEASLSQTASTSTSATANEVQLMNQAKRPRLDTEQRMPEATQRG